MGWIFVADKQLYHENQVGDYETNNYSNNWNCSGYFRIASNECTGQLRSARAHLAGGDACSFRSTCLGQVCNPTNHPLSSAAD